MEIRNEELDMQRSESVAGQPQLDDRADIPRSRYRLMSALIVLGVAAWSITVMAIGLNLAASAWEWTCVFGFGTAIPALFLWQANRLLNRPELSGANLNGEDKYKDLLKVLAERGEITPITAALRTSLTLDEATGILDELAVKNHLVVRAEDGVVVYALREWDRRELFRQPRINRGQQARQKTVERDN